MISQREIERKYNKLLQDVATKDFYKVDLGNRVNCYKCSHPKCDNIMKMKDVAAGVTPMMIPCDECNGTAKSTMYIDIAPDKEPAYEWFRPTLQEVIKMRNKPALLQHFFAGGLDYRKIEVKANLKIT